MNKTEFSIIIPLYNQEKYIEECTKSAINQDFSGTWEIIIVNDGSNDKSEEIIKSFNDKKIKIFKNENGGLAYSRNFGTKQAAGEYIVYLDADDTLADDALKNFYETNKNYEADIILAPYFTKNDLKGQTKLRFPLKKFQNREGFINIENTNGEILKTNFEAWGKAYKRSFILQNDIMSPVIHLAEDLPLFYKALCSTDKILLSKNPVYYYRKGHKGPYKNGKHNYPKECIKSILAADETVKKYDGYKKIEKVYKRNLLRVLAYWNKEFRGLENRKEFFDFSVNFLSKPGYWPLLWEFYIKTSIRNLIDIWQNKY